MNGSTAFRNFDGMCWPVPGERLQRVEWMLRHGDWMSKEDRLIAASVIEAYTRLISLPARTRNARIKRLR